MTTFLWAFSVVAFIGFIVSVVNSHDAQLDVQAVKASRILDGRRLIATSNLRTQVFRAIECIILLSISLLVLAEAPEGLRRVFSTVALTVVSLLIIANSVLDRFVKRRLLAEIYGEVGNDKSE